MLVLMGVMLFMGTRKQKRQMVEMEEMRASITTGSRVQLLSGLFGTVIDANSEFIDLEIAPGVVTRWNKLAVRGVVPVDEAADTYVGAQLSTDEPTDPVVDADADKSDDIADDK
ncbi:protein-export membrane protein YajC [Gordonia araii NBRC 100433]|uniref:Protein-export membrane protein YajC n=2 Tax=Gordonia araii TaxID=263909 RepID=G7H5G2_9ACTN|nr:protein-export membrane protein YajC [Gordonia araii NBRC 100433]